MSSNETGAPKEICNLSANDNIIDGKTNTVDIIHPNGKMDCFYCIFGRCFAKRVIMDNRYYHKVCCFLYSIDGKGSYGIYFPPDEAFPIDENEFYHPGREYCALIFCGICLYYRWKNYSNNYKRYGKEYANYMYYTKQKHYNYHNCCSPDFVD
jgi:hypothetical protein